VLTITRNEDVESWIWNLRVRAAVTLGIPLLVFFVVWWVHACVFIVGGYEWADMLMKYALRRRYGRTVRGGVIRGGTFPVMSFYRCRCCGCGYSYFSACSHCNWAEFLLELLEDLDKVGSIPTEEQYTEAHTSA